MVRVFGILILGLALMGCDSSVTDFVKGGGDPNRDPNPNLPIAPGTGVVGFKVSPGRKTAVATDLSMSAQMTVTPTNRVLSTTDMSMSVTISRGSVSQ